MVFFLILVFTHFPAIRSFVGCAKFLMDKYYSNLYYSKVGGVTIEDMNALEMLFLAKIDFDLLVDIKTYSDFDLFLTQMYQTVRAQTFSFRHFCFLCLSCLHPPLSNDTPHRCTCHCHFRNSAKNWFRKTSPEVFRETRRGFLVGSIDRKNYRCCCCCNHLCIYEKKKINE
jgi:hypothetical protein